VRSVAPNGDALTYRPPERPGIPQLLVIAGWAGLRIHEEAVDWVGDHDSRVDILATALADRRGIARIGRDLVRGTLPTAGLRRSADAPRDGLTGQLLRFGAAGAVSTVGYVLLYAVLRPVAGPQAANALALPACAVANTAANRRLTFGLRGRGGALRHQAKGQLVFSVGLVLTSGSLTVLHHLAPSAARAPILLPVLLPGRTPRRSRPPSLPLLSSSSQTSSCLDDLGPRAPRTSGPALIRPGPSP
jgi:putative flippase GtrA